MRKTQARKASKSKPKDSARRSKPRRTARPERAAPWYLIFQSRMDQLAGDMSNRMLADRTGHNHESIRRYLTFQEPSVGFVVAAAQAFGVSADRLLGLKERKK